MIDDLQQQLSNLRLQNIQLQEQVRCSQLASVSSTDVHKILNALQRNAEPSEAPMGRSPNGRAVLQLPPARKDVSVSRPSSPSAFWGAINPMATAVA